MKFRDFLIQRLHLFFFLVTMILLTQMVLGSIMEPDLVLHYSNFAGTFLMAGLGVLPTFVGYSKKELTLPQLLVREAIQLVMIEGIMVWITTKRLEGPEKIKTAILVCISVAVIFAMVLLMSWLRQRQESQKMTEQLKKLQG
jgi:sensor c-di-GMP phosphodiesterase-like protein